VYLRFDRLFGSKPVGMVFLELHGIELALLDEVHRDQRRRRAALTLDPTSLLCSDSDLGDSADRRRWDRRVATRQCIKAE
jgi:hypothetical protein